MRFNDYTPDAPFRREQRHIAEIRDQKQIRLLISKGHSDHCAKRIVWGDGECECGMLRTVRYPAFFAALAITLLASCGSSGMPTSTVFEVESKHRVGPMLQTCGRADELTPVVEHLWPLVLQAHVDVALVRDVDALERNLLGTRVCLVEEPDICGQTKPCTGRPQCARRRGCAWAWARYAWVARWWPPICRGDWPGEPNCVLPGARRSSNYIPDLAHELAELICQSVGSDAHKEPSKSAQKAAVVAYGGVP